MSQRIRLIGITFLAVAVAWLARTLFDPVFGDQFPFVTFLLAVTFVAWMGGFVYAALATALGYVTAIYFFVPPRSSLAIAAGSHLTGSALYAVVSIAIALFAENMRTALRRAAAQGTAANFLAAVVESSHDAIVSKSVDGIIRTWNAAAERLFQYPAAEAVGRHISFIIPADRTKEEDTIISIIRNGGHVDHFETVRVRKDGQPVYVSLSISPIRDESGAIVGASKIARDMSERHLADRRKDEFLATLAHELRNPLAPISAGLQVMRRAPDNPVAIEAARSMMERQLAHMVRLVNDLLDVSRISRGKIELQREPISVAAVIEHGVETSMPAINAGHHTFQVTMSPEPLFVDGDLTRLGQVFTNLLTNAAKYTQQGGTILCSATRDEDAVVVNVRDNGFGIPADMLSHVFEMFTQLDRPDKSDGGLGIGLTLVKQLVEMHGGTVVARSDGPGKGSEFIVRLPLVAAPSPVAALLNAESPRGASRRILIVDDNVDSAESLAALLQLSTHDVRTAYDGAEAVRVAADFHPDVVLMDIGMPGLNGYEVCKQMRQEPWGNDALIVAMTGWSQAEDRRRSKDAGFDHHLAKPLDILALEKLLEATVLR